MTETYFLEFGVSDIKFEIRVNDIILFSESGGSIDSRIPINHLILPGANIISATIEASDKPLSSSSYVKLRVLNQDSNETIATCSFNYKPDMQGQSFRILEKFLLQDRSIKPSPWMESPIVSLDATLIKNLISKQHEVFSLFKSGNLDAIMKFFELKDKFYSERYNLDPQERLQEARDYYDHYLNDPMWEVSEIPEKEWKINTYAGGKLFSIETKDNFAALYFDNKEEGQSMVIDIFYMLKDGQFICAL